MFSEVIGLREYADRIELDKKNSGASPTQTLWNMQFLRTDSLMPTLRTPYA
jgi:hypothetical protein